MDYGLITEIAPPPIIWMHHQWIFEFNTGKEGNFTNTHLSIYQLTQIFPFVKNTQICLWYVCPWVGGFIESEYSSIVPTYNVSMVNL